MSHAYPLQWPAGRPRTERNHRHSSDFKTAFVRARDALVREIRLLTKGGLAVISTNFTLRRDGLPASGQRTPEDPGVAVYFLYQGRQMSFACDRWKTVEENMQAICKTINALRGIARWGSDDMLQASFSGFAQLPAPPTELWWDVLGVASDATLSQCRFAYQKKRSEHHPDRGGDVDMMKKINAAWEQAQIERA